MSIANTIKYVYGNKTPAVNSILEEFKDYFQSNLLDGDDVYDCGGAMLRAEDVYEVLSEHLENALQTTAKEQYATAREATLKEVEDIIDKVEKDVKVDIAPNKVPSSNPIILGYKSATKQIKQLIKELGVEEKKYDGSQHIQHHTKDRCVDWCPKCKKELINKD